MTRQSARAGILTRVAHRGKRVRGNGQPQWRIEGIAASPSFSRRMKLWARRRCWRRETCGDGRHRAAARWRVFAALGARQTAASENE